jgi:hypothetical protein
MGSSMDRRQGSLFVFGTTLHARISECTTNLVGSIHTLVICDGDGEQREEHAEYARALEHLA